MLTVSNSKVAGFTPLWAPFAGFSLLFDNPGKNSTRLWRGKTLNACDLNAEPALALYKALFQAFSSFDLPLLTSTYGLCPLPPHSYHVTVLDCGNAGNAHLIHPHFALSFQELLHGLPESWNETHSVVRPLATSEMVLNKSWRITFRYRKLELWSHNAIVVTLEPADVPSGVQVELLRKTRTTLTTDCKSKFGFGGNPLYTPHITLAYLANKEGAALALNRMAEWNEILGEKTRGLNLNLESVAAYGFTDMATFFKS